MERIIQNIEKSVPSQSNKPSQDSTKAVPADAASKYQVTESIPSAATNASPEDKQNEARLEVFRQVYATMSELQSKINMLERSDFEDKNSAIDKLQELLTKLKKLQSKFDSVPQWNSGSILQEQQRATIITQLQNMAQLAQVEIKRINQNLASDVIKTKSVHKQPEMATKRTGWWDPEYQRTQVSEGVQLDATESDEASGNVDADTKEVSETTTEPFDFAALEQHYQSLLHNPLVTVPADEETTLPSMYENYQQIVSDPEKSDDVKKQAGQNVLDYMNDIDPTPSTFEEVDNKMQQMENFLATVSVDFLDQVEIDLLRDEYESIVQAEGEPATEFVGRKVVKYNELESLVLSLGLSDQLTTDKAQEAVTSAASPEIDDEDDITMSKADARSEALEAEFTQVVQHHVHNLRLLLESEGRRTGFRRVTSNGPLKQEDITRWLEQSEKKYTQLRTKLIEHSTDDLVDWAEEQIAPLEIKLGWRKKPSLFTRIFG